MHVLYLQEGWKGKEGDGDDAKLTGSLSIMSSWRQQAPL